MQVNYQARNAQNLLPQLSEKEIRLEVIMKLIINWCHWRIIQFIDEDTAWFHAYQLMLCHQTNDRNRRNWRAYRVYTDLLFL